MCWHLGSGASATSPAASTSRACRADFRRLGRQLSANHRSEATREVKAAPGLVALTVLTLSDLVVAMDLLDDRIIKSLLPSGIEELPAVDIAAVADECDALVEDLVAHGARQHEPVVALRRVVEVRVGVGILDHELAVGFDRPAGFIGGGNGQHPRQLVARDPEGADLRVAGGAGHELIGRDLHRETVLLITGFEHGS